MRFPHTLLAYRLALLAVAWKQRRRPGRRALDRRVISNRFLRCSWIENSSPRGASISIRSGTMSVEQSILGDPQSEATECLSQSTVESHCNVGGPTTGDRFEFESRMDIRGCDSSTSSLCTITWGNLKSRYR